MSIQILNTQQSEEITVVQFRTEQQDSIEYITGRAGIERNGVRVEEVSESASVNDLYVINETDYYVFFTDGDILVGAKQNRVLNASIFLSPKSKIKVPVSCVERGRWHYRSRRFTSAEEISPPSLRATKSSRLSEDLRERGMHYADQSEVWQMVSEHSRSRKVDSETEDYIMTLRQAKETSRDKGKSFTPHDDANGAAVFIGERLVEFEVFNRREVFREYFPKIVDAVLFETVPEEMPPLSPDEKSAGLRVMEFYDKILAAKKEKHKGVAEGEDLRFFSAGFTGSDLVFREKSIHLSALPASEQPPPKRPRGRQNNRYTPEV